MSDDTIPLITIDEKTNCSKLVAELILDHFGIAKKDQDLHLLAGMGKGMGLGSICGGLAGGMFAINLLLNRSGASDLEIEDAHRTFRHAFLEKFSAVNCSEIIDLHFEQKPHEYEERQARFCGNLLDESSSEVVEIVNMVVSQINPISTSMNQH